MRSKGGGGEVSRGRVRHLPKQLVASGGAEEEGGVHVVCADLLSLPIKDFLKKKKIPAFARLVFCLSLRIGICGAEDNIYSRPAMRASNLRKIYFLKLLCFERNTHKKKTISHRASRARAPAEQRGIVHLEKGGRRKKNGRKKKLAWAAAFINFPSPAFFLRPLACLPWIGN